MLRLLCSYVGNLATMRSSAFTCCAGCDALPVPLGRRLCVSCSSRFPVDAALTGDWDAPSARAARSALGAAMPWLRRVFVPSGAREAADSENTGVLPEGMDENALHGVEDLSEYFLVVPREMPPLPRQPLLREDFFTTNGMPLLFAAPGGCADAPLFLSGLAGRTKRLSALFAEAPDRDEAAPEHAFARWAYEERHGILAPNPCEA